MIVLRIILIDCLSLIEFERVTQLIYIPLLPPIFSINEHLQRFIDVKLSGSKESKLRRISSFTSETWMYQGSIICAVDEASFLHFMTQLVEFGLLIYTKVT